MKKPVFVIIAVIVCFSACETEPDQGFMPVLPSQKVRTYPYSFALVWNAIMDLIVLNDIDLIMIDSDKGQVVTDFIPLDPKSEMGKKVIFREEGERIIKSAKYDITFALNSIDENTTRVKLDVHIDKSSRSLWSYYSMKEQLSNGYIEKKFLDDIAALLEEK